MCATEIGCARGSGEQAVVTDAMEPGGSEAARCYASHAALSDRYKISRQ
jgi:hypothetical protein